MTDRPFVSARYAAEQLGVPEAVVIEDVKRGWAHLDSLNGGQGGDYWLVYSYEVEGDRLDLHRARLQGAVSRAQSVEGKE
jgi:hypothetical protein